tara:strand:+ start:1058 stop:2230 length:1173 start_codon:yes stop_codon:yes gene_type:complete
VSKKTITILGSTGSIGTNTVDVIKNNKNYFSVLSLTAKDNVNLLTKQANTLKPKYVAIQNKNKYKDLKNNLFGKKIKILAGDDGVLELTDKKVSFVIAAIVGLAGLKPTYNSIKNCKRMCLANKECLVSAGDFFMKEIKKYDCELLPVDSEHNAIFQLCNSSKLSNDIESITLTASGGPFRKYNLNQLRKATLQKALKHPNWKMGSKITIDSATMMNKAFEVIEAYHLFNLKINQINVIVHPESIIHSMVNFVDGTTTALLSDHDMRIPIFYSLFWPSRKSYNLKRINLNKINKFTFTNLNKFLKQAINMAFLSLKKGGSKPLILNAANEIAVKHFLNKKIKFLDILNTVKYILKSSKNYKLKSINDVYFFDKEIRSITDNYLRDNKWNY